MNRLARMLVAVLAISASLGALLGASPTLAGNVRPPTFTVVMGGCISGKLPQDYTAVDVVWRDKNGHRKAKFHYQTSEYGYWYAPDSVCATHTAAKGDTIQAHITVPTDVTRTFTVKSVTGTFNRISNVIAGTAPAAGQLYLDIGRPELALNSYVSVCEHLTPVDSTGHYSYDTSGCATGYDAIGGDEALADWIDSSGDRISHEMHAPYVEANQRSAKVDGFVDPAGSIALTLRSKSGALRASTHAAADAFGGWHATFHKSGGAPVVPNPNDMITGNWPGQGYKVRALSVQWDLAANTVQGFCTPDTAYGLLVRWTDSFAFLDDTTDAAGATSVLTITGHQLVTGDQISLVCMRPNGDRTKLVEAIPE